jgi:uncharacterized YccA/Bax inhibitor family protein
METSNPVLKYDVYGKERSYAVGETMTVQGAINKTFILLFLMLLPAYWVWNSLAQSQPIFGEGAGTISPMLLPLVIGGGILGMIIGLVTAFKREWAPVLAPIYAICQGFMLGGISAMFERQYQGIVFQAVALTTGTLFCLLMAYKSGLIRATEHFKAGVVAATGAVMIVYVFGWIMSLFHHPLNIFTSSGTFGIIFSVVVVGIAALNLVLDFSMIEEGANMRVPKYMEWYSAFGLMVTLIWLYIEILKLLAKLKDRR